MNCLRLQTEAEMPKDPALAKTPAVTEGSIFMNFLRLQTEVDDHKIETALAEIK